MLPRPSISTLFPYTTLFRSRGLVQRVRAFPSRDRQAALEELQPHRTGHPLLRARDRGIERIPLRRPPRSEEHTSELQSQSNLVCRLLLEKKKKKNIKNIKRK